MPRLAIILFLLSMLCTVRASALEPPRVGQESFLKRAIVTDGTLWMLSDSGQLFRIAQGQEAAVKEDLPDPAIDLCRLGGRPAIVACEGKGCGEWSLRRWARGKWSTDVTLKTEGDNLVALSCDGDQASILSNRRFIRIDSTKPRAILLSEKLQAGMVTSVHLAGDFVFVGINAGEWGGGLRRIDLRSGNVTTSEHNATGELCGGPLNSQCDPVNGIADEPGHPGCLVVAVGLVHFVSSGRLVEVCGDRIERLYSGPYEGEPTILDLKGNDDERLGTVAFFGLIREGDMLWAVGTDGIYRYASGKVEHVGPLPSFRSVGGFDVSFDLPHVVMVLTSVNQRRSISGGVPMLIPR